MSDYVVNRTKIKLMNYLGGMVGAPWRNQWIFLSDLEMASNHCGMPPRLKGSIIFVITRSLRVQPQAIMGSGLVD